MPLSLKRVQPGDIIHYQDWNNMAGAIEDLELEIQALRQLISSTGGPPPVGTLTMGPPTATAAPIASPHADFIFQVDVQALSVDGTFIVTPSVTPAAFTARALTPGGQPLPILQLSATAGAAYTQEVRVRVEIPAGSNGTAGTVALQLTSVRNPQLLVTSQLPFTVGQAGQVNAFPITTAPISLPAGQSRRITLTLGSSGVLVPAGTYRVDFATSGVWALDRAQATLPVASPGVVSTRVQLTAGAGADTLSVVVRDLEAAPVAIVARADFPLGN
ncbi:MAG: hypothetical protein H6730_17745 [Deltaproteobacteria bacterium]|nr:hypothetical protein [Deltaproteobacteria bacterium]